MATNEGTAGFFRKRELIYAAQPNAAALRAQGGAMLESGLFENALELFSKAGDQEGIARVAQGARAAGDAFAYEAAAKALGTAVSAEEWVAIGETAFSAGLLWFAYRAFEKADRQEALERVRKAMFDAGIAPPGEAR